MYAMKEMSKAKIVTKKSVNSVLNERKLLLWLLGLVRSLLKLLSLWKLGFNKVFNYLLGLNLI